MATVRMCILVRSGRSDESSVRSGNDGQEQPRREHQQVDGALHHVRAPRADPDRADRDREPEQHHVLAVDPEHERQVAELARGLSLRQYTPQSLDSLTYDEAGLSALRQMTRGEQVNSKLLAAPSYDLIFSGISAFVARHE